MLTVLRAGAWSYTVVCKKTFNMAKSDESCGLSSKANSTNENKYTKDQKKLQSEELNPSSMYLATKYHDDGLEELVYLYFDDSMMKALKLTPKKTK